MTDGNMDDSTLHEQNERTNEHWATERTRSKWRCNIHLSRLGVELVEGRQHEDSRLTHTRLGLAHDIHTQDGLQNIMSAQRSRSGQMNTDSVFHVRADIVKLHTPDN